MRIGVNSGSLPKHLHELERENPVEALVAAAVEFVELMESLDFEDFKVSIKSTNVPNTIAANRLLAERIPYPLHLGITEAGTKWSGSLKSAVGLGTLLADGVGDTIRISLSTFHAEEEVKVAWEILKALGLRERGPVLIACPTCGRLQFDMDTVVAEIEPRLEAYEEPIEVAVLGCAVNGIGEASHADFGITGAKNEGLIFAHGKPLRKVPQDDLVDALFAEIDKSIDRGGVEVDEAQGRRGRGLAAEDRGGERRRPDARSGSRRWSRGRPEAEGKDGTGEEPFLQASSSARPALRRGRLADGGQALRRRARLIALAARWRGSPSYFLPTLRDDPADAEAASHKLMVRAGLVRQLGAGPLELAARRLPLDQEGRGDPARGDRRDRRPGDAAPGAAAGRALAQTGRYGIEELFKLDDRKDAEHVLAMTHEEALTFHVARDVRSYRDLPLILYHLQIKERDEPRPRAGVLRTREFTMKDSYSFDRDDEGLDELRDAHRGVRPDLRSLRPALVPGRIRRRDDGGLGRPRVHGALRGGGERGRARARVRRQRRGRLGRAAGGRAAAGARRAARGADARADDGRGGLRGARGAAGAR